MNLVAASGSAVLLKRSPHPNAAKVVLNWLLSREGQVAYQENYGVGGTRDSRRIDIPKDGVRPEFRRVDGVKYFDVDLPEYIDPKPIQDLMNRVLRSERK